MKNLSLNTEKVIVNLFKMDRKEYVTVERLMDLVSYIQDQLINNYRQEYDEMIFNVSYDSIERAVLFNNDVFSLLHGDVIYLKTEKIPQKLSERCKLDKNLLKIYKEFFRLTSKSNIVLDNSNAVFGKTENNKTKLSHFVK